MADDEKFLLVSLNEQKAKKLAQIISNDTCRKIIDFLAEKEASESEIAKKLKVPISTVHYNLKHLMKAKLITVDEFHYSKKGKEINHYKLANKYIIIAPKETSSIKDALRKILPVGIILVVVSAVIQFFSMFLSAGSMATKSMDLAPKTIENIVTKTIPITQEVVTSALPKAAEMVVEGASAASSSVASDAVATTVINVTTNHTITEITKTVVHETVKLVPAQVPAWHSLALWFLIGGIAVIILYLIFEIIRNRKK